MARTLDIRRSRLLLGALVLAHLLIVSHQVDVGGGASLLERLVFAALSPLQQLVGGAMRGVNEAWSGYLDLRHVRQENQRLKERLRVVEALLQEKQDEAREAARLREILGLREILPMETVVADVVARDGAPWFRTLTLNKGSNDGVELNAPVISPLGILGRVIAVGPSAAKVQLLLDRDSGVGVLIERSRITGVVSGQIGFADSGDTDLAIKYVSSLADVVPGDVVVTSGLDRIFPKGLVVGRVRSVRPPAGLFKEVVVAPAARFDRTEEALIVKRQPETSLLTESVR